VKAIGIVLGFAAYTVGTWGYVLVKGYNVTLREWVTPLHPFTGPLDSKGCVPKGKIFPVSGQGGPCASSNSGGAAPGAVTQPASGGGDKSFGHVPVRSQ
jgi:hypothetical protein